MTAPVLRCYCGAIHLTTLVPVTARCACGALLWPQMNRPGGTA